MKAKEGGVPCSGESLEAVCVVKKMPIAILAE
jgi:hypothetical protein